MRDQYQRAKHFVKRGSAQMPIQNQEQFIFEIESSRFEVHPLPHAATRQRENACAGHRNDHAVQRLHGKH